MLQFGSIEAVSLRNIWVDEGLDFTPWLAQSEHLKELGVALNMDLVVEKTECFVGVNRADILARDLNTDALIVIENQLEPANHSHLGQIITYASGTSARYAIWIASEFSNDHVTAIAWLNGLNEQFQIFAVELEVWKINGSLPAIVFNAVLTPSVKIKRVNVAKYKDKQVSLFKTEEEEEIFSWLSTCGSTLSLQTIAEHTQITMRKLRNRVESKAIRATKNKEIVYKDSFVAWMRAEGFVQESKIVHLNAIQQEDENIDQSAR